VIEEVLIYLINKYGLIGLFFVMILQTVIAPIPSEALLVFAGTLGLGIINILIFGGTGMLMGAVIAFFAARIGREVLVKKLVGERWINRVDKWVEKNGTVAILISRLIPVIPFDLISYVAGLTNLSFKSYFIATLLGAYPRTLMLAMIGSSFGSVLRLLGFTIELIMLVGVIGIIVFLILDKFGYITRFKDFVVGKLVGESI